MGGWRDEPLGLAASAERFFTQYTLAEILAPTVAVASRGCAATPRIDRMKPCAGMFVTAARLDPFGASWRGTVGQRSHRHQTAPTSRSGLIVRMIVRVVRPAKKAPTKELAGDRSGWHADQIGVVGRKRERDHTSRVHVGTDVHVVAVIDDGVGGRCDRKIHVLDGQRQGIGLDHRPVGIDNLERDARCGALEDLFANPHGISLAP